MSMSGPDDFLRDTVSRAGDAIPAGVPADLSGTLEHRRSRLVRRRVARRVAAGGVALVLVGALVVRAGAEDDAADEVIIGADPSTTTSQPAPETTGTAPAATDVTSTTVPSTTTTDPPTTTTTAPAETGTPIDESTPISLYGIGAVRGGMTIAEAEEATGQTLTIEGFDDFGGTCYFARIDGLDELYFLIVNDAGASDPRQGVVGRVSATAGPWRTISGLGVGSTRAEVLAAYGDRIVESPHAYVDGSYLDYVPADPADAAFMLRFATNGDTVTEVHAGLEGPAGSIEGCA
jgi:hypothetical protein